MNNRNMIIVHLLILGLMVLFVPFTVFAESCETNNVMIKSIEQKNKSGGTEEKTEATIENNKINLDITMSDVDDYIEYEFNVENRSDEDIIFNEKSITSEDNHFNYELTYDDNSNVIKSHDDKDVTLTITYTREIEESEFENGIYQLDETNNLRLMNSLLTNPNTINYFYIVFIITLGVAAIIGLIVINNKYMRTIILLCFLIPTSVYALCSYDIEINTNIEVSNLPKISSINIGEYITLTPDLDTYTTPDENVTGIANQTVIPSELTLWRVIAKNEDGTVDAISEYVSSNLVKFTASSSNVTTSGIIGYANFIGGLQEIAQSYKKEGYTKSIRMMGYDGQTLTIEDTSLFDGTIENPTLSTTSTPSPTTGSGEEYENGLYGDTLYLKDYLLVKNVYGNIIAYKVGTTKAETYWLASRQYKYGKKSEFGARWVTTVGTLSMIRFRPYGAVSTGNAVRPIITLESYVKISYGDGSKNSPYTLIK